MVKTFFSLLVVCLALYCVPVVQAEETKPTRTSDGSRSCAKIGRKAEDRLMLMIKVKDEAKSSKYVLGYVLSPTNLFLHLR